MKRISIDPVTRLEGHGKIDIFLDAAGGVERAYLQVPELRGFEVFSIGRPAEDMPQITSRICGVCPTAHHMAATKALDALYHVQPPPAGRMIKSRSLGLAPIAADDDGIAVLPENRLGNVVDDDPQHALGLAQREFGFFSFGDIAEEERDLALTGAHADQFVAAGDGPIAKVEDLRFKQFARIQRGAQGFVDGSVGQRRKGFVQRFANQRLMIDRNGH